jgi:phage-related protein
MINHKLYVLKKYNEHEGYLRELQVYKVEQIYRNIFVDNCDQMVYQGNTFQYTVCHYSKLGSLC